MIGSRQLSQSLIGGFLFLAVALSCIQQTSSNTEKQKFSAQSEGTTTKLPLRAEPLFFNRTTASRSSDTPAASIAPTEWDDRRKRLLRGEVHDENAAAMGGVAGHAGLFGTAQSVLAVSGAWLGYLHAGRPLLDRHLVEAFTTRQPHPEGSSWALGWDTPTTPSSSGTQFSSGSFGHLGFTGTSLWIDPQRKLEIVLLTNRVHPSRTNDAIRAFRPMIHDLVYRELAQA